MTDIKVRGWRDGTKALAILLLAGAWVGCSAVERESAPRDEGKRIDAGTVLALLDLVDTIVSKNPDYAGALKSLDSLDPAGRRGRLEEWKARNARDPDIQARADAFLGSPAMRVYFRRFTNVTPEDFRRVLHALPYEWTDSPGDIATALFGLVARRDTVRAWVEMLRSRVDLRRCRDRAAGWLPGGPYPVPEVGLVYDSNAGSYTAEGKAYFNLYTDAFRTLARDGGPAGAGEDEMEGIIAHEMHHVFAEPFLERALSAARPAPREATDPVVVAMVSEGAAIHCNPPAGFRKDLWEDPRTVEALLAELNGRFLAVKEGRMGRRGFRGWYSDTFQGIPRRLLEGYVARTYPENDRKAVTARFIPQRPDLVHALGWWMVSRVSRQGEDREAVKALVKNPLSLFRLYNAALGDSQEALKVDPRLITE